MTVAVLPFAGTVSWRGGDPFWHGGPSRAVADVIKAHTMTGNDGRRYWKRQWEGWRRLRNADKAAWKELNAIIDRAR